MSNTPHRPFVPKKTPAERPTPGAAQDFRVVRPFVHGQARSYQAEANVVDAKRTEAIAEVDAKPVGSIADFLALDTPSAMTDFESPGAGAEAEALVSTSSITDYLAAGQVYESVPYQVESDYELPPIEHFTDTISEDPSEEATPQPEAYSDSFMDPFGGETQAPPDPSGWGETDWQRYDWRSAAALGDAGDKAASSAWAQTDWGNPGTSAKDSRDSAARAIADALDGIVRRIRDGDLIIPPPPASVPDPATIAATLAALLGIRR